MITTGYELLRRVIALNALVFSYFRTFSSNFKLSNTIHQQAKCKLTLIDCKQAGRNIITA